MRVAVVSLVIAAVAFVGARFARDSVVARAPYGSSDPYAPSPEAAPFLSLGYRELAADIFYVRLTGYFGSDDSNSSAISALCNAIVVLDPKLHHAYEYGALAMIFAKRGVSQHSYFRALKLLDTGMDNFPEDWKLPHLAGEIYTQDLKTDDPALRRIWDEKGVRLTESAIRKPGAPQTAATWAAIMRTKLGQHERAVQGLREMLLITTDASTRKRLIEELAKLEDQDAYEVAAEIQEQRLKVDAAWKRERPEIPVLWYILLGAHPSGKIDMTALATGGRDLVGSEDIQKLEPLE